LLGSIVRKRVLRGYVFEDCPVEDVVVLESLADKEISEEFPQICIIRFIVKSQTPRIIQKDSKFIGKATTQRLGRRRHLLLHNPVILLLLRSSLETLPRQRSPAKVHHDVSERFKVITPGLLDSQMSVDGGVASSACEVFVLAVGDVEMGFGVAVFFGETKVDYVDLVSAFADSHEEVVWFDVAVDE